MSKNLNDVLTEVSAVVSQTTTVTNTSDEYSLWKSYVNMAQTEWAESYEWSQLFIEYNTKTSYPSQATITLPTNFRKLSGYPKISIDGLTTKEYAEIDSQKKTQYEDSDEYCYVLNTTGQSYLIVNPYDELVSGASIFVSYWRSPASLVSPADVVDCPNPEYLVKRTIAYVWEAREDERYLQAQAEASRILGNLIEMEQSKGYAYDSKIQTVEENKYGFRLGRD